MSPESTKRKLTAILSADVKGYSRLMEDDEEATVATLTTYRQVIAGVVQKHEGRVVDSPGDNVLAEFPSVVEAMRGAVEVQEELRARNAELSDHRRMEFRIGINLGDVIEEEGRIYGDGVNIAARVESLADAGGICLAESAYQQVKNKLSLGIEFLGEHEVKNISEPVPVYRLVMEAGAAKAPGKSPKKAQPSLWRKWAVPTIPAIIVAVVAVALWQVYLRPKPPVVEPASVERMAFPLPEKPSLAVLPFVNMSGDPDQEYIADGISENLIAALAKLSEMFVIARNSSFSYKGKSPKVQTVAEELGVKHVLEGSVQRSGDRMRITAQLIDATTGHHLWSERYDRDMGDLFDLQDEITTEIAVALQVELTRGAQARLRQTTRNLEAWQYATRGYSHAKRVTKEDNTRARELFEQALERDPEYAFAWTFLAWTHWMDATNGWTEARSESFQRAAELAEKARTLDDSDPDVHALLGSLLLSRRQHEQAIAEGEKAVALGPNHADSHALLAMTKFYAGRPEEAVELVQKAMRLQPYYPPWYIWALGHSYRVARRYEEAVTAFDQLLELGRKGQWDRLGPHLALAECYVLLGRDEKARSHVEEVLKIDPDYSLEAASQYLGESCFYQDLEFSKNSS
jgi:TolB-like protein/class 3 adenylate cyclase/tetratricopeptide (TPR) repeat protein